MVAEDDPSSPGVLDSDELHNRDLQLPTIENKSLHPKDSCKTQWHDRLSELTVGVDCVLSTTPVCNDSINQL